MTAIYLPFVIAKISFFNSLTLYFELIVSIVFCVNFSINNFHALFIKRDSTKKIKIRFLFFLICIIPWEFFALIFSLKSLIYLQFFRVFYLLYIVEKKRDLQIYKSYFRYLNILISVMGLYLFFHYISFCWLLFTYKQDLDFISNYINSMYWTITTLTTVGYGDITPEGNASKVFTMLVMLLGVAMYGLVIASISKLVFYKNKHKEEFEAKIRNLVMCMDYYDFPKETQEQLYAYYDHLSKVSLTGTEKQIIKKITRLLKK